MGHYKSNSTNSGIFSLTKDDVKVGELKYSNWYSFKAEILLADNSLYQIEPKGFWDSRIELQKDGKTLLYFEMGWKGITIKTQFRGAEKKYLLTLKGLFSSKYILVDTEEKELLTVDTELKWTKLNLDVNIHTSEEFDNLENKELLLFTVLHCINYNIAFISSAT